MGLASTFLKGFLSSLRALGEKEDRVQKSPGGAQVLGLGTLTVGGSPVPRSLYSALQSLLPKVKQISLRC